MKIKVKEKLNFQELINYIYENNIKNGEYSSDDDGNLINTVFVDKYVLEFNDDSYITKDDTWTIEHEVEISKETKLPLILVGDGKVFVNYTNLSIKEVEERYLSYVYGVETIHLINNDKTHTLIYKDGELVE